MKLSFKDEYNQVEQELTIARNNMQNLQNQRLLLEQQNNNSSGQLENINNQIRLIDNQINSLNQEQSLLNIRFNELKKELKQKEQLLDTTINNQKEIEQKISQSLERTKQYTEMLLNLDSILTKYSEFNGVSINTETMVIKVTPQQEPLNNELAKKICEEQSIKSFNEVLEKMEDINTVDFNGMTLLMYALKHGFWYGVEKLLSMNADVNIIDNKGCNALIYACTLPRMKYIKSIIEKTDNLNLKSNLGSTALHNFINCCNNLIFSSERNDELKNFSVNESIIVMDEPLHWPANISLNTGILRMFGAAQPIILCNPEGENLTLAIKEKLFSVTELLIKKGGDINVQDSNGMTPFYISCLKGDIRVVSILKDFGADINILNKNGYHPIHAAVHNGHIEVIKELLKWGVGIDTKSTNGYTPLQYYCEQPSAKLEVVEFLLSKGASVFCTQGDNLKTLLHSAVLSNVPQIVEFVLAKGIDVNVPSKGGFTPLYWACAKNYFEIVKLLIEKGGNVNICGESGDYPIGMACNLASLEVVEFLVNSGAKLDTLNKTGCNLMHEAFYGGKLEIIKFMIKQGLPLDIKCNNGKLPLHYLLETKLVSNEVKANVIKELKSVLDENGIDVLAITEHCSHEVFQLLNQGQEQLQLFTVEEKNIIEFSGDINIHDDN